MLKSIDPILGADVLYALRAMGHGDELVICDMNFPADATARQSVLKRLLRIDNVTAGRAARAILSVLPLDSFVDKPALRMEIVGKPDEVPPVQIEVKTEIDAAQGRPSPMGSIERFAFYELAKRSYCVIQTGERRFYGCFIFKKGVIAPDAALLKRIGKTRAATNGGHSSCNAESALPSRCAASNSRCRCLQLAEHARHHASPRIR